MASARGPHKPRQQRTAGFTLIEVIVATALLGLIASGVLGGLLFGMKEATRGKLRGAAAAWMEAELDYLRVQGYAGLADDIAASPRSITATTGCTSGTPAKYGDICEPTIPTGFDHAIVKVEDGYPLAMRQITLALYETASGGAYAIVSTYLSNFTYAGSP